MIARRHVRAVALAAFVGMCALGCETRTGDEPRPRAGPVGVPPWTVGGATLGMAPDDVQRILGEPTQSRTSYGITTTTWREIAVTFDREGHAIEVFGDRLTSPRGATILSRGASEADIVAQLGEGRLKSAFAPSGSGVITCSYRRTGATYSYQDATTRYEISVHENQLASVRLLPLKPPPPAGRPRT